jgi:hypothetical protein
MRKTFVGILLTALVAACSGAAPSPSVDRPTPAPSSNPTANPTSNPTPEPSPSPSTEPSAAFYLRAWYTQALPPQFTFNWLPLVTIDNGVALDGNVAIPAIFPGPLLIQPIARSITEAGTDAIAAEAERLGLLGGTTDFADGTILPGSKTGQIQIVIDGVTHDLIGNPGEIVTCQSGECVADPGSAQAFAVFWQEILFLDGWIADELGPSGDYQPERVAVLFVAPANGEGMQQQQVLWPLEETFDTVGVEFPGEAGSRCRTYAGDDLATLLPFLQDGNQLTIFHDLDDNQRSAVTVVVVPGAESPCPDES